MLFLFGMLRILRRGGGGNLQPIGTSDSVSPTAVVAAAFSFPGARTMMSRVTTTTAVFDNRWLLLGASRIVFTNSPGGGGGGGGDRGRVSKEGERLVRRRRR